MVKGVPYAEDPSHSVIARVLEHGNYGVQLFFVISGFVLALPFASHYLCQTRAVSLRAYFLRRLTRLEPPYVLSMLLFLDSRWIEFIRLCCFCRKSSRPTERLGS